MKNWLKRNAGVILSSCLGTLFYYRFGGACLCMFGEPEFPTED